MIETILDKLHNIEVQHQIKIIYAVESGSRAWGFSSKDSDYDIRFIYINKPEWYLSVLKQKDNINIMDKNLDLDFAGWDIKKTLELLLKSNMSLYEWFNSPIIYIDAIQIKELKKIASNFWNKTSLIFSYAALARNNYKVYIIGRDKVKAKKYLYILRTLAAAIWIENKDSFPPIEMSKLAEILLNDDKKIGAFLSNLIEIKKTGTELGIIETQKEVNKWIEYKLNYYLKYIPHHDKPQKDVAKLNNYFYRTAINDNPISESLSTNQLC